MVGGATRAVSLTNTDFHLPAPGPTFDGRDVFAPVAAPLCPGTYLAEPGAIVEPASAVPDLIPVLHGEDGALVCDVLLIDRLGNCQLTADPRLRSLWR